MQYFKPSNSNPIRISNISNPILIHKPFKAMFNKRIILSFLLLLPATIALAQTKVPDDVVAAVKSRVDKGIHFSIVVGVVDASGTAYYSYGLKSEKNKEAVDEHTVYEIGSISKTFTGILLADAVLKGKMKLDDPLQKYLPKDVTAPTRNGAAIKLVNLSNHTSSLPRLPDNFHPANAANPYVDYTEKQTYAFLNSYPLSQDIGSNYAYSNYAVGLLGLILANQKGVSYEQLMIDVIAKPLELNDTRIVLTPNMQKNLALGHDQGSEVANWDFTSTVAGAGGIRSTAADMLKYVSANMGSIKSKVYPAMELSHKNTRAAGETPMVGLGWHISPVADNNEMVWHNGGTGGYRSFCGFIKGENKGVVVLTSSAESVDDIGVHILNPSSPLNERKKAAEATSDVDVSPVILDTYVGQYELAPGFILTVSRKENQLSAQATGQGKLPVFAKSENIFFYKVVEAQLVFNKNDKGVVESVTLLQGGQKITGKKIE